MAKYPPTKKYRVRVTRLIEQECEFYIDVPSHADEEAVMDLAEEMAEQVTDNIWTRDGSTAPEKFTVEMIEPMDKPQE